jgi:serine/threonine-protein kinase
MGNVYLAVAHGPGGFHKLVAIKELKPEFAEDATHVAMFLEEARLAARLAHPNIVQTNEVLSDGNRHFMVMEYLDGRTLFKVARDSVSRGGFSPGAHLRIISDALLGLHHAHELRSFDGEPLGIVHRDVSPLNVVVTFDGQVKVVDFGIAKAMDSALKTRVGVLKGRIGYMAPEQACGGLVDRRADVYAAGVMIWEAASGRRLWGDMTDVEVLAQMLREAPLPLHAVCPDAPADLEAICARALARRPEERYPTAEALREDLEAHLARRRDCPSTREIGALLSEAYAPERRHTSAVIEEVLGQALEPRGSNPAAFDRVERSSASVRLPSRAHSTSHDLVSLATLVSAASSRSGIAATGRSGVESGPSASWPRIGEPAGRLSPEREPLASRLRVVAIVVTFALLCAAAGLVARRGAGVAVNSIPATPPLVQASASVLAPAAALPAAAPPTGGPAPAPPALVRVAVRATPPRAEVRLDGRPLGTTPIVFEASRDSQVHRVDISADGYESKSEDVTLSGDVTVDVALERRAAPAPARAHVVVVPTTPPRASASPPASAPGGPESARPVAAVDVPAASASQSVRPPDSPAAKPARRPIVTSNPYGAP